MAKQKIQLSDHFNYSRLLRFVLPCIGTMLFTSIYGVVDGLCVSIFVGKTAFAAVNLIMPLPMLIGTVGFMLGTGGSAIVGITLGEGDEDKANRYFSLFVYTAFLVGVVLSVVGFFAVRPAAVLLGCRLCGAESLVTGVSVVLAAMPMGGVTAVLAEKYGGDSAFASKCVAVSTVLSLITTPLWCMVV